MVNVILFGAGNLANSIAEGVLLHNDESYHIIGVCDNDPAKLHKNWHGYDISYPSELLVGTDFDYVVLCSIHQEIYNQLVYGYKVEKERVKDRFFLLQLSMAYKYKDNNNIEIKEVLNWWKQGHELTIYNQFILEDEEDCLEVLWDKRRNMPYVMFPTVDGKTARMYYPRHYHFDVLDGQLVLKGVQSEQQKNSPHLYVHDGHNVHEGDVLADVGTCEGNFAIKYINVASKIYLFESDDMWIEPLHYTFSDDKHFEIIHNNVSLRSGMHCVKLDDAIHGRIDFIKMDIEGEEINALLGAERLFMENDVKCSICSYHRYGDEVTIKKILKTYGYHTYTSNGYMAFLYDSDIFLYADFRRGIVYGNK